MPIIPTEPTEPEIMRSIPDMMANTAAALDLILIVLLLD